MSKCMVSGCPYAPLVGQRHCSAHATQGYDFLPGASWCIATVDGLHTHMKRLTPEQLDRAVPQLKEWRERAIELQLEPAAMAAEQMRLWEERDKLIEAGSNLRTLLLSFVSVREAEGAFAAWDAAVGEKGG